MKIKHLLTLLLTMATLPALAQGSGIKGKVVSRGDRAAIEQVKITLTPGERQATSDLPTKLLLSCPKPLPQT